MTRHITLAALLILFVSSPSAPTSLEGAEGASKPNFVFIFADDQCYETIHALGNDEVATPNLDRLSRGGLTFTHAYNQGSYSGAVCVASRTMLNTGRFLWHAKGVYAKAEEERKAGRFWSEHLKKAGYETYFTGKWHVPAKAELAFDQCQHVRPGMPNQTPAGYHRPVEGKPDPWKPWDTRYEGFWKGGRHWSEVVGDDAVGYIERANGRSEPFFMYLAFNAPHDPRQSPKEYVDRYPLEKVQVPENYIPEYPYKDAIGCGKGLRDEQLAPFPRTRYAVKVHRQEYYAIITHMDAQVGRILDALERSGKADSTYVFFSADHGLAVGHHGLLGKQNLYEHSVRVPFLVTGPDVPKGKRSSARIYLQDVMPTTLELAGVKRPDHVQFQSLLPLIRGATDRSPYEAIYGGYLKLQRSVILGDQKLILYPKVPVARLFDLKSDPLEMRDLAGKPESKERMRKLFSKLLELQKETGDTLDLREAFPEL